MKKPIDVDEYIAGFPKEIQRILEQVRMTIKEIVPQANEVISYGTRAYKLNSLLVWLAAHTNHVGFYPKSFGIGAFKKELSGFKHAKGSVQFPFDKPFPIELIKNMIKSGLAENLQKVKMK